MTLPKESCTYSTHLKFENKRENHTKKSIFTALPKIKFQSEMGEFFFIRRGEGLLLAIFIEFFIQGKGR
jgi:hypothetical protein